MLGMRVAGYFDKKETSINPYHLPYCGNEWETAVSDIVQNNYVFPGVGDNKLRKKIVEFFYAANLRQLTLIDPGAMVSPTATIGLSTYIGRRATVNALASVGKGCIINTASIVEHECNIEDFTHIAPAAVLCGNVAVGDLSFVGANAVVRQGVKIHTGALIGAGTTVINDIPPNTRWVGNPARQLH